MAELEETLNYGKYWSVFQITYTKIIIEANKSSKSKNKITISRYIKLTITIVALVAYSATHDSYATARYVA